MKKVYKKSKNLTVTANSLWTAYGLRPYNYEIVSDCMYNMFMYDVSAYAEL